MNLRARTSHRLAYMTGPNQTWYRRMDLPHVCPSCPNQRESSERVFQRRRRLVDGALDEMQRTPSSQILFPPRYHGNLAESSGRPTVMFPRTQ